MRLHSPEQQNLDGMAIDEHHGDGNLVEGQEDAAIY